MALTLQKYILKQNSQLATLQSLGLWFSKCQQKQEIWVNWKHPIAKLPITNPLKLGSPVFSFLMEMKNWHLQL